MGTSYKDVVERLIEYRQSMGYTHEQMADKLGISQGMYTKLENRTKVITYNVMMKMKAIGMDLDYLITGERTSETKINEMFEACEFNRRTFFINLVISYMDEWLNSDKMLAECNKELKLIRYHVEKAHNIEQGTVWSHIRKIHNLTQLDMKDILDIDIKTYRKIEKGESMPTAESLAKLYDKLGYYPSLIEEEPNYLVPVNHAWNNLHEDDKNKLVWVIKCNLDYVEGNVYED